MDGSQIWNFLCFGDTELEYIKLPEKVPLILLKNIIQRS